MKIPAVAFVAVLTAWPLPAAAHVYNVPSPTHAQTFAYGSERRQQWLMSGPDRHLALGTEFTNDPYVDRVDPRQYDDFVFEFPSVRLGANGRTFYFQTAKGQRIAVAERHPGVFGLDSIHLLDSSFLVIEKPHGLLSLSIFVSDRPEPRSASL